MCTPLPTPSTAVLGAKEQCQPRLRQSSRTVSRSSTARSADASASAGASVISNWSLPYSGMNTSGATPASRRAPINAGPKGSARRWACSAKAGAAGQFMSSNWNSCSKEASSVSPVSVSRSASACLRKLRGQQTQGVPSRSTRSLMMMSSGVVEPSMAKRKCAASSGSRRRSPDEPQGLGSAMRSKGVSDMLAGTQPTVFCCPGT